jgi:hypothetical protein
LKIRLDALAVSSVLLTVAFLMLTPRAVVWALMTYQSRFGDRAFYPAPGIPWDQVVIPNYYAPLGITSLAIIAKGLVVTWAGYIRGVRWTWLVMFVVVWVWAFPVRVFPFLYPWHAGYSISETIEEALHGNWNARDFLKVVLAFLLMVVALVLPLKTFILRQGVGGGTSGCAPGSASDRASRACGKRPA